MIITEQDLKDIPRILDEIQTFQDNQIRCKDMSNDILALREFGNNNAIVFLEGIVGKGNVSNKTLRKVLNTMHESMLAAAKSGLVIHES